MSTNRSKLHQNQLEEQLQALRAFLSGKQPQADAKVLLSYVDTLEQALCQRRYGLVFEHYQERAERLLDMAYLMRDEERCITGERPHLLIEGNNLPALKLLCEEYEGQVDVVYIDPPYNTGSRDFPYADQFFDARYDYPHSKWLSFIEKRLLLLRRLLAQSGYLCISIDGNEQAGLKLLCDEIFGEANCVACLPRRTKSSGKTTRSISANHDYLLIYCKNLSKVAIRGLPHVDAGFRYEDEYVAQRGRYKLNQTLDYDSLQYTASLDYPLELDGETFYPGGSYEKYLARKKGDHQRADWAWRWCRELVEFGRENGFLVVRRKPDGCARIYTKTYLNAAIRRGKGGYAVELVTRTKPLSSLEFTAAAYSNDNAKKDLKRMLPDLTFDYPKPVALVRKLLEICPNQNALVLDCFAGTATTGQAVLELNQADGGHRRFLLVNNNQNNICRDAAYPRLQRALALSGAADGLDYLRVEYHAEDE